MTTTAADHGAVPVEARSTTVVRVRDGLFVYAFAVLYGAIYFAAASAMYLYYLAPRYDLGNMVQVVWATAHGHVLRMSDASGADISRLGAHADPFLVLLTPLWWVWSSPLVLFAAQAFAVASGAVPVYWLSRKHLKDKRFAAAFSVAYLLYIPTQCNAFDFYGVHAVSFAIPFILFAVWFLDNGRLVAFAGFALLAASTKEEIGAAVAGLGIWYALRRGERRVGACVFAAGAGISLFNFLVVIPHFAVGGKSPFTARYAAVGGTPGGMVQTAFTHPSAYVDQLATWHNLLFLVLMLAPFLGLWAFEPLMLVGAVPDLAVNLLSSHSSQSTIFGHYTAGITPFVVAASILGAAKVKRRRFVGPALIGGASMLMVGGPLLYATLLDDPGVGRQVDAMRQAKQLIPPNASVSASRSLGGDVSTRRTVMLFPQVGGAQWVLVGPPTEFDQSRAFQLRLAQLESSRQWTKTFDRSGVELFRRTAGGRS
jgi:uncharacterized membrane protein